MFYNLSPTWLILFLVWVVLSLFNLPIEASSRLVWEKNGHSYQRVENDMTWPEAKNHCESQDSYLATITSKEENDFIFSQFGGSDISLWLGGTDAGHEGTWTWVTNEPWSYSNWKAGEPNNYQGVDETYLNMEPEGTWNDNSYPKFWFVCEWNGDGQNNSIVLTLEEPAPGSVYSGISNVRGWAVAPQGLQKIWLYVDGTLQGNIPLGGKRTDVGAAYSSYPGAADSGFAMAYNYSNLTAGPHTLIVRAYDPTGGVRDASAAFTVARFATPFIADSTAVNLDNATITRGGNTLTVQNLQAAGQSYNAQLTWRPATQGFALTQINTGGGNPTAFSADSPTLSDPLPSIPTSGTSTGSGADVTLLSAQPTAGETIVLVLEEPAPGSVYSGIANVRGWAVAPAGIQKVELYVDGQLFSNIPLGGRRADVGGAYSSYPGSADSGYAMAFNYSGLSAGPHTLTARAYDASGGAHDASAAFTVTRFAEAFMADPAAVNLDQTTLARAGNTITIQKLLAAGQPYNVQLTWRPATQGFALTQIEESMNSCRATLSPSTLNVPASGGTGNISVSIPSDCPWTVNSDVPWIIITSGASGVGSGAVAFTVSANLSNVQRSGTLIIASQTVTLRQESGDPGGGGQ